MSADPIDDDITHELQVEGGLSNDPADKGGLTNGGISQVANPDLNVATLTEAEKREIYRQRYVIAPGYDKITSPRLQAQMIDFGVNSGPAVATMKLQSVMGLKQDGILGPITLQAINAHAPDALNRALAIARIKMLGQIVVKNPSQLKFLNGWLDRATQFIQ